MQAQRHVTIVSHGPNCLDGLTAALVASRYFSDRSCDVVFSSNRDIENILLDYRPADPASAELWVTDISWHTAATDGHLRWLVECGLELYWVDHHRSAMEARKAGRLDVPFTDFVLDDRYAASRLLYHYLCDRAERLDRPCPELVELHNLVMLADDVDRWVLDIDGSRDLALTVRAMKQEDAFHALAALGPDLEYGPELREAAGRVQGAVDESLELAQSTRHIESVETRGLTVVSAECNGYAGEVAHLWSESYRNTVFALSDRLGGAISLRRTDDCDIDLSRLAAAFGGGGHPAAAGCDIRRSGDAVAPAVARQLANALTREIDR